MSFEITMVDATTETVDGADAYEMEGPMTTFFVSNGRHQRLSSFSTRVASYRTDRLTRIRRVEAPPAQPRAYLEVV
ncbi:MAG: hypothetical protein U0V73_12135 [Acidimicrobiia bacterium]